MFGFIPITKVFIIKLKAKRQLFSIFYKTTENVSIDKYFRCYILPIAMIIQVINKRISRFFADRFQT